MVGMMNTTFGNPCWNGSSFPLRSTISIVSLFPFFFVATQLTHKNQHPPRRKWKNYEWKALFATTKSIILLVSIESRTNRQQQQIILFLTPWNLRTYKSSIHFTVVHIFLSLALRTHRDNCNRGKSSVLLDIAHEHDGSVVSRIHARNPSEILYRNIPLCLSPQTSAVHVEEFMPSLSDHRWRSVCEENDGNTCATRMCACVYV